MLINAKVNAVEIDRHYEVNFVKADLRATGVQVNSRDEKQLPRIENMGVMVAVSVAIFFISKLGVLGGLLLTAFCLAILCVTYAKPFLQFTGGSNIPIQLGERLDTASRKSGEWIRSIMDDLRDPQNRD
jgi:hypothetical protein